MLTNRKRMTLLSATVCAVATCAAFATGASAHDGGSFCHGTYTNTAHGEGRCELPFQGFPVGVVGAYDPADADDPTARGEIHVELFWRWGNNNERPLGVECERSGSGAVECEGRYNPFDRPLTAVEPVPRKALTLICRSHSHAPVRSGVEGQALFGCWSTVEAQDALAAEGVGDGSGADDGGEDPGPGGPGVEPPTALQSAVTAVPINTYAPARVIAQRTAGLKFLNLDANRHDVVALKATRPDGSAPWCADYGSGKCPLFWSELIPGGGTQTPVLGLEDAEAGRAYDFYCSIHPYMVGEIQVVS